ncbi:tryptophan halogenase [Cellvibrio zantedeschiae]|uniref:Tryptophan halogenase n=1 Tax=Cellvibrio zantedeschiae TaxID=1237077 RepID=A0ABQ3AQ74_9GAMM|nr:tryptophan halogenase family protein [Cellvibrio zantedeschiae]GGY62389.1 tryptophan halogenase [Cellvibrio zantedeschiae]
MKIKRVAIIGGGTAGWLAANHLGVELKQDKEIEITVIESQQIGIIGVGEGTVPHIKNSLQRFGISEAELFATCDVAFKEAIKFVDWLNPEKHGAGYSYYHPFNTPYPSGFDVTPYWLSNRDDFNFSAVTPLTAVADAMRSPKKISSPPYMGEVDYAYHFDAVKFGKLLAKNARERLSVKHLITTLIGAKKNEDGSIAALVCEDGSELEFDFYVDCSGFASLLIDRELSVPFIDKSSQILTDTALAFQVPTDGIAEIEPYTIATAHKAGWIWDIPLSNRRGTGFVYSSSHMSESEAIEYYSKYLKMDADKLSPRKISMKVGYREKFWVKNCVALGLAQGFVEPLEATSILVTDFSAELFARNFPRMKEDINVSSGYCNKVVSYTWERVFDFVQLHYCISDRNDSDFWLDNTKLDNLSDVLAERLAMWKLNHPKKPDFFSRFDLFAVENYLYVLYGMKYITRKPLLSNYEIDISKAQLQQVQQVSQKLSRELPGHREWITKFKLAVGDAYSR